MATTENPHIEVAAKIVFDLAQPFTMQGIANTIQLAYPRDTGLTVVGIAVPILGIGCNITGIIDPFGALKDACSRLYNYLMKSILEPVWNLLYKLYEKLKSLGLAFLDLALGIFDLHVSDLFSDKLWDKIKAGIADLYYKAKDKLFALLEKLGIPKFSFEFNSPELEIEEFVKRIMASLWSTFFKILDKIISLIQSGLKLWDMINRTGFSITWDEIYKATIGKIISFFLTGLSIQEITDAIIAFAKKVYNKAVVTFEEIMKCIKDFKLPVFGKPFDWDLPWNPNINFPNLDFAKLVTDIKLWLSNFLISIITKFMNLITKILEFFVGPFKLPVLTIPLTLCAVKNNTA
jgi:hypothetical protein